ncbi:hypothetical protein MMC30_005454, partial [Trapelia coarctata]|nr:hypothetical protein [Trapelia coarctata]
SHRFYTICIASPAAFSPIVPLLHGQPFLPPYPQLLLAATARQLADWTVLSPSNRGTLFATLLGGPDALLELAARVSRLRLRDIREVYAKKGTLLVPLATIVEADSGRESHRVEAEANGHDYVAEEDSYAVCSDPFGALLNYWIYSELFHHTIDSALAGVTDAKELPAPLGAETRRRFVAYCVPDRRNRNRDDFDEVVREQLHSSQQMRQGEGFEGRKTGLLAFWNEGARGGE